MSADYKQPRPRLSEEDLREMNPAPELFFCWARVPHLQQITPGEGTKTNINPNNSIDFSHTIYDPGGGETLDRRVEGRAESRGPIFHPKNTAWVS